MTCIDTILVIVDTGATHQAGLAKGALLAQKCQARLDLFACNNSVATARQLQLLARRLRHYRLEVTTQTARANSVSTALAEHLKHAHATLVIRDIRQHTITKRASLSYSDWDLIRRCPAALLLSKPTLWPERPRICAGIDPAYCSHAGVSTDPIVMERGALLAIKLEGELHVWEASSTPECNLRANIVVIGSTATALIEQVPGDVLVARAANAPTLLR